MVRRARAIIDRMRSVTLGGFGLLSVATACVSLPPVEASVDGCALPDASSGTPPANDGGVTPTGDAAVVLPPPKPPCDPAAQPSANAVFVSTMGDDLLGGTRAAPVKTITKALSIAAAQSASDIYVDEGVYGEAITIGKPLTIHGAWKSVGATWTKDCSDGAVGLTVIRSTTARAVTVTGVSGTAGLDGLTVTTKGQADGNDSAIAIFVSSASLELQGVDVIAGIGGDGTSPGAPAQAGNRTCNGGGCSTGTPGVQGAAGGPAGAGSFDVSGWVPAIGTPGQTGAQGENGTPGGAGQSIEPCVVGCGSPPACPAGPTGTSSAGNGTCGCGGVGGAPGAPGPSGGASVAVMIVGPGSLHVAHSNLTSARGGNGAAGGAGGPGGGGTGGAKGVDGFCAGDCFFNSPTSTCYFSGTGLAGGSPGGAGGAGGTGGPGGGGAGGPSFAVVSVSGAAATLEPTVKVQNGPGGSGAGGAPTGPSGTKFP